MKLHVEPGPCGFSCTVTALREGKGVRMTLSSACRQISAMARETGLLGVHDILSAVPQNPVYAAAARARCHATCPVPLAALKCAEAEMGLALPRNVHITFEI